MAERDYLPNKNGLDSEQAETKLVKSDYLERNEINSAINNVHTEFNAKEQGSNFSGERSNKLNAAASSSTTSMSNFHVDSSYQTTLPSENFTEDSLQSDWKMCERDAFTKENFEGKKQLHATATYNSSIRNGQIYKKISDDGYHIRKLNDGKNNPFMVLNHPQFEENRKEVDQQCDLNLNEFYTNFENTKNDGNFMSFEDCSNVERYTNQFNERELEPGEIEETEQTKTDSEISTSSMEHAELLERCQSTQMNHDICHNSTNNDEKPVNNNIEGNSKTCHKRKNVVDGEEKCPSDAKKVKRTNHQKEVDFEYDIIDDLELSSDMDYGENFPDGTSESDYNDVPEEVIDAMLDEGLDAYRRKKGEKDEESQSAVEDDDLTHEEREKVVLKVRGHDHFEILPEGWIEVTHNSGMPVYLHKVTRVCTLSKPYFLGPGSARKHEIPLTAIPCLHYRREIEKEKSGTTEEEEVQLVESSPCEGTNATSSDNSKAQLPSAKIESVLDNNKEKSLDHLQVRKYCEKLFEFQTITVRRFKTWAGRRKHQKLVKQLQRPTLPSGTKLITCPLPPPADKDEAAPVKPRREFTMNPNGKSHVCILHEYVQHAMRVQPKYIFKELENAKKPYGATVIINDMEYGTGYGSSKKQAKSEAAKTTLEILIPQIRQVNSEEGSSIAEQQDLAFFDEVRIEDPRISELCAKAGQPSPYQILLECLKRNYGMGDTEVKLEMQTLKHQKNEFTMTVGKHTAKVICKNKRDGKQRASQAILQSLHSHIRSWGSLLRLYGKGSCKTLKEKKLEEQQITELQSRASANRPNLSILNKLKEEMLKLKEKREAVKPIGKFMPGDVELPMDSGCNLQNLDL